MDKKGFGDYVFDMEFPHEQGAIPMKYLGKAPSGGQSIMWLVRAGASYQQERHAHAHLLMIVEGTGTFSLEGEEHPYEPGATFHVRGNRAHGFTRVDEDTVVLQRGPCCKAHGNE